MNIVVNLGYPIKDGSEVVFRSPVDCSLITGLKLYYPAEDGTAASMEFALADAHGNNVGDIDHLFAENVVVKVILDVTSGMAFVQNADTNAYLEGRFAELEGSYDKKLTAGDFEIGSVNTTNGNLSASTSFARTGNLLECTQDVPYSVEYNGNSTLENEDKSTFSVFYYGNGEYLAYKGSITVTDPIDNICRFCPEAKRNYITHIRIAINYHNKKETVTEENLATVVGEFTFTRKYNDPLVRQSELAGYISQETGERMQLEMDYCTGKNLICTVEQKTQGGIAITHAGGGKYDVTQSAVTSDVSMAIYDKSNALPPNIERGKTYRFGGNFPDGASMRIIVYGGSGKLSDNSLSRQHTKDISIPEDATGLAVYLFFSSKYEYAGKTLQTEMISAESTKYACELVRKHHPDTQPPPMLTIIDDDGYKNFATLLKPVIERRKVPIASAIPIQEIETKPDKVMDWATIEDCADAGAEIISHTYSNLGVEKARETWKDENGKDVYGKRLLTDADIIHDYRLAQTQLRRHGLNGEGLVFVKDSSNLPECVSACKQVYSYGFKADPNEGISTDPLINYRGQTDRYGILRNGATGATKAQLVEMFKKLLVIHKDGSVSAGTGWLVLMLHTSTNSYDATQVGYLEQAIAELQGWTDAETGEQLIQIVTAEHGARTYCD